MKILNFKKCTVKKYISIIRICDEEEEIPLHLRIKNHRSKPYPTSTTDTDTKPTYNIDEYVIHLYIYFYHRLF